MKSLKIIPALLLFLLFYSCDQTTKRIEKGDSIVADTVPSIYHYGFRVDSLVATDYPIVAGNNISSIFRNLGFSATKTEEMIHSCRDVLDPGRLQVGRNYTVYSTNDSIPVIRYVVFSKSQTAFAVLDLTGDIISSYSYEKEITIRKKYVEGVLTSSLWNSLKSQDVDPMLAIYISDVYAWEIDFFDVKEGDSYRVLYDEVFIDDTTRLRINSIQGAVFNHLKRDFVAIPFTQDSIFEFFDEEGNSLRKTFLKAPLDFFRITSHFSNSRFHPVLKRYRAHHGVDYAAPVGTPVKSIGAGVVVAQTYQGGGAGNYVKIKHNSVYTTSYMHLSKFAKGLQVGKTVQQGEVIGYVGSTGLSTGPHLDFRVYKNGQAINPLKMEAPPSKPIRPELLDSFKVVKQQVLNELRMTD